MWPFGKRAKNIEPVPAIRCGEVLVRWNMDFKWWEFSAGDFEYSLPDNPVFDPMVLSKLDTVHSWLATLEAPINLEIGKHLDGWSEWKGMKDLVCINVSWLVDRNEIDVSYAHDDWADLGVNIVIVDGKIKESYAGD